MDVNVNTLSIICTVNASCAILTSFLRSGSSRLRRISKRGMRKARVLPLPVTASAATSLLDRNNGMVAV